MKFGVRAHDFGEKDVISLANIIRENGFEAVHLAVKKALKGIRGNADLKSDDIENIKRAFEGLELSVLGSYIDFTTDDDSVWHNHRDEFIAALKVSNELGAKYVGSESSYGTIAMEDKVRTFPVFLKRLDELLNEAHKYNAFIAMEPVAAHTLYSAEWTAKMLDTLGSDRLKIIFDPLNMLTFDRVDTQEKLWRECIDAFGEQTEIIHLKDGVFSGEGRHIPRKLGEGIARYDVICAWVRKNKQNIPIIREEQKPEFAKDDLMYMKKIFS